ncbi:hypothetical protein [Flavobacterium sp. I3-2]|uniref:hypothetical protein n=1 Tax=Flavobacterium sp. I3-2 TaxID=2748319 RepID=UPI0015B2DD4B|nr:hypothetical protein [Flavobacterium sp. I3-2]
MITQICSCKGLNANCQKCFGSGYVRTATLKKSTEKQNKKNQIESFLPENITTLSKSDIEQVAIKIISNLDLKSKKQMQILNSIPFNTNTFRRDFGSKFELLEQIEIEKQQLRNELLIVDQEIVSKNYRFNFTFKHYLSDKDVDVSSNRHLKELIREYKKLKK